MEKSPRTRRVALLCLAACLAWPAWGPAPARADTLTVTTTTDRDNATYTPGNCSLREAVKFAGSGDTVEFSTNGIFTLTLGEIAINKNLTIQGNNPKATDSFTTVSGNASSRVFNITSGTVTIKNLVVTQGRANVYPGGGGGIQNSGTLTLDTVRVANCTAQGTNGGGVYSDGNIIITGCYISGNTSTSNYMGGGVMVKEETGTTVAAVISDTIFISNQAEGSGGGLCGTSADLYISGCTFEQNDSLGTGTGKGGGGVRVNMGSATITDSTFHQNTAAINGGGVSASSGQPLIVMGSTFTENEAGEQGGGLYASYSALRFCNDTFFNNKAGQNGGALWLLHNLAGQAEMSFCTIFYNFADSDCGSGGTCNDGDGGGIYLADNDLHLKGVILALNFDQSSGSPLPGDCAIGSGAITTLGYNMIGSNDGIFAIFPEGQPNANQDFVGTSASPINPSLFPPADNGGPTKTSRPGIYSVAPNHGPPDCCDVAGNPVTTDQRGLNRNRGGCPDIGAYEVPVGGSAPLAVLLD